MHIKDDVNTYLAGERGGEDLNVGFLILKK